MVTDTLCSKVHMDGEHLYGWKLTVIVHYLFSSPLRVIRIVRCLGTLTRSLVLLLLLLLLLTYELPDVLLRIFRHLIYQLAASRNTRRLIRVDGESLKPKASNERTNTHFSRASQLSAACRAH